MRTRFEGEDSESCLETSKMRCQVQLSPWISGLEMNVSDVAPKPRRTRATGWALGHCVGWMVIKAVGVNGITEEESIK